MDELIISLGLPWQFVLLAAAIPLIAYSADRFVEGASAIAGSFGLSELIIGLTIVSWGTSGPELVVSVIASLDGMGDMAVGNVVGSDIFNVGLILGMCALFKPIPIEKRLIEREGPTLITGTAIITFSLMAFGGLNLWVGVVLLSLLGFYFFSIYNLAKSDRKAAKELTSDVDIKQDDATPVLKSAILFALGLFGILFSCKVMVAAATGVAQQMQVSQWVIAVTVVAAGTSMPEFAASFAGILKGKYDIAAGNILGSEIMNFIGVLGIASLISKIEVAPQAKMSMLFAFLTIAALYWVMRKQRKLTRRDGVVLILIGLSRWTYDILMSGPTA